MVGGEVMTELERGWSEEIKEISWLEVRE